MNKLLHSGVRERWHKLPTSQARRDAEGVRVSATREYTAWGTVVGTGAASIEIILMEASQPLSIHEIEEEVRRRGLTERGAVSRHLNVLKGRGHIINTPAGWCRVVLAPEHTGAAPTPPARSVPRRVTSKTPSSTPPLPLSASPVPPAAPTERLQRIKLVLEIGVVAVTLIGGIIALIWKTK
jgi:hypothetical protein